MRHLWIVLGALASSPADVCERVTYGNRAPKSTFLTDSISKDLNHEWTRIHTNTGATAPSGFAPISED
jgi:hypothetical protein